MTSLFFSSFFSNPKKSWPLALLLIKTPLFVLIPYQFLFNYVPILPVLHFIHIIQNNPNFLTQRLPWLIWVISNRPGFYLLSCLLMYTRPILTSFLLLIFNCLNLEFLILIIFKNSNLNNFGSYFFCFLSSFFILSLFLHNSSTLWAHSLTYYSTLVSLVLEILNVFIKHIWLHIALELLRQNRNKLNPTVFH